MKIILPIRTISELNARGHWAAKARRAEAQRGAAYLFVKSRWTGGRPVAITMTRIAPRRLDDDNLRGALKAVRDGIADALGINDGDQAVEWRYGQRCGGVREYAVEVEIA